ncbi:MAG: acyl carrier protein [Anaerolineae bacterium]|nr:acyl carrier protein [Anaerolineae bacterium]
MEDIKAQIKTFILKEFLPGQDEAELTETTPLISGNILDSLATLKLVSFLEEQFKIEIEAYEADVDHFETIEKIAALVVSKST